MIIFPRHTDSECSAICLLHNIRWAQQGLELAGGRCGALCEMRADLLEFTGACGFKNWANNENPCFCCTCPKHELYDFPANMESSQWRPRDAVEYNTMVQRCLFTRVVSRVIFGRLKLCLKFDDRYGGATQNVVWGVIFCMWQQSSSEAHIQSTILGWLSHGVRAHAEPEIHEITTQVIGYVGFCRMFACHAHWNIDSETSL